MYTTFWKNERLKRYGSWTFWDDSIKLKWTESDNSALLPQAPLISAILGFYESAHQAQSWIESAWQTNDGKQLLNFEPVKQRLDPGNGHFWQYWRGSSTSTRKELRLKTTAYFRVSLQLHSSDSCISEKVGKAENTYCTHVAQRPQNERFATIWTTISSRTCFTYGYAFVGLFWVQEELHTVNIDLKVQAPNQKLMILTIGRNIMTGTTLVANIMTEMNFSFFKRKLQQCRARF